jgi:hypothetical protein
MANTKISELTTWTGDTTGFYVVVDNSGLTQTYKTTRENLLGSWVSAGTINAVGWSGTTTNPTIGTTFENAIYYKQIGNKEWEINLIFDPNTGGSVGSGDYIFKLPNNLSFDLTFPGQTVYTSGTGGLSSWANATHALPASGTITQGTEGGQVYPVLWNSTSFRIVTTTYLSSNIRFWSSSFYQLVGSINMKFSFIST